MPMKPIFYFFLLTTTAFAGPLPEYCYNKSPAFMAAISDRLFQWCGSPWNISMMAEFNCKGKVLELWPGDFKGFENKMNSIHFNDCDLSTLPENIFQDLWSSSVHFNGSSPFQKDRNLIEEINPGFLYITRVKGPFPDKLVSHADIRLLSIRETDAEEFSSEFLTGIKQLESIELYGPNLKSLPENFLEPHKDSLKHVEIGSGKFDVHPNFFRNLSNIITIKFHSKKDALPDMLFSSHPTLTYIYLSGGHSILPPFLFADLPNLKLLDLSYNPLPYLNPVYFRDLKNLRVLNLLQTNIAHLPLNTFDGVADLRHLILKRELSYYGWTGPVVPWEEIAKLQKKRFPKLRYGDCPFSSCHYPIDD